MKRQEKMTATKRQHLIINRLEKTTEPITGSDFAHLTNVSRQVIVQDVAILKAKKYPIVATSRGYLLETTNDALKMAIIAVSHTPEQTETELNIIVDHGVTVKDVTVEHALYGQITGSIMVSNRVEVAAFIKKMHVTNSPHLSSLTDGVHLHTLVADSYEKINAARASLAAAHILIE